MVPSSPDPGLVALAVVLFRYVLMGASAVGVWHGSVEDPTTATMLGLLASAVVGAGTVCWAIWDRCRTALRAHQSNVASAAAGNAVQVK